ncbi:hypothetical protein [uncultured Marinobacter sp.]|uniref:hypothetical protein n=1 Tax=uncultured Marinobacter sp. TaxID=187379 RepID=UPI0030D97D0A
MNKTPTKGSPSDDKRKTGKDDELTDEERNQDQGKSGKHGNKSGGTVLGDINDDSKKK